MTKVHFRKLLFVFFSFLILLGLAISYFLFSQQGERQLSYFDLRSYPRAQTVDELRYLQPRDITQVKLHSQDSVPQVSKWYRENFRGSGWLLDVQPQNPNDEQIQLIRLTKDDYVLSISLIGDGHGGTDIILEQVNIAPPDKKNTN